jgi:hypothetical protein
MAYNTGTTPTLAQLITGKFVPEIFSKLVIDHVQSNLVVANSVNTVYEKELKKGSVVNIPVMSEISTSEVTPGTEASPSSTVGTAESITIDKWRYAAIEVSDMAKLENDPDYIDKSRKSLGYAILKYLDTTLGALFSTLSSSSVAGSDGQEMDDDKLLGIIQALDEADVPDDGNRCIIGDPSTWVDLLKIDKFVKSDYGNGKVVPSGQMGQIYNMAFKKTNNLTAATTGNYGVVMHRDALGLVIQENPRTKVIDQPEKFRTLVVNDIIFGCAEIRDTFGKAFYTRKS